MAEYKPLTKEERETHAAFCERQLRVRIGNSEEAILHDMAHLSLRYEATVQDRDDRIAALEADNARLRPLAEVGEAVEGMPVGFGLSHAAEDIWLTWDNRGLDDEVDETCGQTALATLRELAALRAAKGEKTDYAH